MRVYDTLKIRNDVTALICDRYKDEEITSTIKSNLGIHTNIQSEVVRDCFCVAKTRILYVIGEDVSGITEVEFV